MFTNVQNKYLPKPRDSKLRCDNSVIVQCMLIYITTLFRKIYYNNENFNIDW